MVPTMPVDDIGATVYRRASAVTDTPRLKARSMPALSRCRQHEHCDPRRAGILATLCDANLRRGCRSSPVVALPLQFRSTLKYIRSNQQLCNQAVPHRLPPKRENTADKKRSRRIHEKATTCSSVVFPSEIRGYGYDTVRIVWTRRYGTYGGSHL